MPRSGDDCQTLSSERPVLLERKARNSPELSQSAL